MILYNHNDITIIISKPNFLFYKNAAKEEIEVSTDFVL